jgi:hypothetical protein
MPNATAMMLMWVGATDAWLPDEGMFIGSQTDERMHVWRKTQMVRDAVIWCVDTVG